MQETKIKICGITNLADARFVAGARADYMGFIFYEGSDRHITPAKAGAMSTWIEGPQKVGVFVNQPLDDVNMIARQTDIDIVQLHGTESAEYCALIEKSVMKVVHVEETSTTESLQEEIEKYRSVIDYVLFDTGSTGQWGGSGQSFDWQSIVGIDSEIPFFLSGGLNASNVEKACHVADPYAIDVCSGLEREPGKKDFDKIEQFMDAARAACSSE